MRNSFDAKGVLFGTGGFFMRNGDGEVVDGVFFVNFVIHGMEEGVSVVPSVLSVLGKSVLFRYGHMEIGAWSSHVWIMIETRMN